MNGRLTFDCIDRITLFFVEFVRLMRERERNENVVSLSSQYTLTDSYNSIR